MQDGLNEKDQVIKKREDDRKVMDSILHFH
jgi:hypothetical protein